jgi:hypothetical protein
VTVDASLAFAEPAPSLVDPPAVAVAEAPARRGLGDPSIGFVQAETIRVVGGDPFWQGALDVGCSASCPAAALELDRTAGYLEESVVSKATADKEPRGVFGGASHLSIQDDGSRTFARSIAGPLRHDYRFQRDAVHELREQVVVV